MGAGLCLREVLCDGVETGQARGGSAARRPIVSLLMQQHTSPFAPLPANAAYCGHANPANVQIA
jgi:hypothetical protein